MTESRDLIVDSLRSRVLRGIQAGTLREGDRLPSARELVREFDVDHRIILEAYRHLVDEGLLELRARGGVYVAARAVSASGHPRLPEKWFVEVLTQALVRELPPTDIHEWLRRCTETLRTRSAVIAATWDQVYGICRELRDDFGLEADGITAADLRAASPPPIALRRADLIVATAAHEGQARAVATSLSKPLIVLEIRPDFAGGEWTLLLRRPVYAIVATSEFAGMMREFFAEIPGAENLHILVLGEADIGSIPDGAPTYVTQRVRTQLGGLKIPGRILPAARTISMQSAREIFSFIVHSNLEALDRAE